MKQGASDRRITLPGFFPSPGRIRSRVRDTITPRALRIVFYEQSIERSLPIRSSNLKGFWINPAGVSPANRRAASSSA